MRPWKIVEPLPDGRVRITLQDPRDDRCLLWPQRFPEEEVKKLELALGQFASSQLQQDPTPQTGSIFRAEWIKFWSPAGSIPGTVTLPALGSSLISADMAFKGEDSSDPSCMGVWRRAGGKFFLLDLEWGRFDFPGLLEAMARLINRWPRVLHKIVEDKANGPAVVDSLQAKYPGFESITPEGGKESRAHSVAPLFAVGLVFLPHPTLFPWVNDAVQELIRFPRGSHDDFVDMTTQALLKLHINSSSLPEVMASLRRDPGLRSILGK